MPPPTLNSEEPVIETDRKSGNNVAAQVQAIRGMMAAR